VADDSLSKPKLLRNKRRRGGPSERLFLHPPHRIHPQSPPASAKRLFNKKKKKKKKKKKEKPKYPRAQVTLLKKPNT